MRIVPSSWYFFIPRRLYLILRIFIALLVIILLVECDYRYRRVYDLAIGIEGFTLALSCVFLCARFAGKNLRPILRVCSSVRVFCISLHTLNNIHEEGLYYLIIFGDILLFLIDYDLWYRYGPCFNTFQRVDLEES